jgi:hypothetical protein
MIYQEKIETFLKERAGLDPTDLSLALTTIISVKYATFFLFVAGGVRYRPLGKLFANVGRRTKRKFGEALERDVENKSWTAEFRRSVKTNAQAFKGSTPKAPPTPPLPLQSAPNSFSSRAFEWVGLKYRHYSVLLSSKVSANPLFARFSKTIGLEPTFFAIGVAEGMLLYKATVLIHFPLEIYGVCKYFQYKAKRRRRKNSLDVKKATEIEILLKNNDKLEEAAAAKAVAAVEADEEDDNGFFNVGDLVTLGSIVYDDEYADDDDDEKRRRTKHH